MRTKIRSALKDPFIRDLVKAGLAVLALIAAAIGIKILRDYLKK